MFNSRALQDRDEAHFADASRRLTVECHGALCTNRGGRAWDTATREFGCGTQPVQSASRYPTPSASAIELARRSTPTAPPRRDASAKWASPPSCGTTLAGGLTLRVARGLRLLLRRRSRAAPRRLR